MQNHPSLDRHKWFRRAQRRTRVRFRLFCLPYAGGSPTAFDQWSHHLPEFVEVIALRLPGHDSRINESSYSDWSSLLHDLVRELAPFLDQPFGFFGHSFGARLAYELTWRFEEMGTPVPRRLFISGCRCPHHPHRQPLLHLLPSGEFRARVIAENENMTEIENIEEIVELLEPMLRAEIGMAERWGGANKPTLSVPISAFAGQEDDIDPPEKMIEWKSYTQNEFSFSTFPGGHFFLHSCEQSLLEHISRELIADHGPVVCEVRV